jgi:hypothetical protein
MAGEFETTFVFKLAIEGANAVKQAEAFKTKLAAALSGTESVASSAQAFLDLGQALKKASGHLPTFTERMGRAAKAAQEAAGPLGELVNYYNALAAAAQGASEALSSATSATRAAAQASSQHQRAAAAAAARRQDPAGTATAAAQQMANVSSALRRSPLTALGPGSAPRALLPAGYGSGTIIIVPAGGFAQPTALPSGSIPRQLSAGSAPRALLPAYAESLAAQQSWRYAQESDATARVSGALPAAAFSVQAMAQATQQAGQGFNRMGQMSRVAHIAMAAFTDGVNETTAEIWGLRRAAYGMESFGRSLYRGGVQGLEWAREQSNAYLELSGALTRAGIAMELNADLRDELFSRTLETSSELGAFSPGELAEGLRVWAAGTGAVINNSTDLNRTLAETVAIQKLASLNNVDLASTTDHVGAIIKEFGLQLSDVNHVVEVLNYVSANTFANVTDIGQAFRMVGPVAASMGVSFEETATSLALLSDANIKGTMAGRAVRQMFMRMLKPTADYNEVMNETLGLGKSTASIWQDMVFPEGEFVGMARYIDLLAEATANLTEQERNQRLAVMATANELPALTYLVTQQISARADGVNIVSGYEKAMKGVQDAEVMAYRTWYEKTTGLPFTLEGAHARMTRSWEEWEKSDTARAQRAQRAWENAFLGISESLSKTLIPMLERGAENMERIAALVDKHPWLVDAAVYGMLGSMAIGMPLQAVASAVKTGTNIMALKGGLAGVNKVFAAQQAAIAAASAVPAAGAGAAGAAKLASYSVGTSFASQAGAAAAGGGAAWMAGLPAAATLVPLAAAVAAAVIVYLGAKAPDAMARKAAIPKNLFSEKDAAMEGLLRGNTRQMWAIPTEAGMVRVTKEPTGDERGLAIQGDYYPTTQIFVYNGQAMRVDPSTLTAKNFQYYSWHQVPSEPTNDTSVMSAYSALLLAQQPGLERHNARVAARDKRIAAREEYGPQLQALELGRNRSVFLENQSYGQDRARMLAEQGRAAAQALAAYQLDRLRSQRDFDLSEARALEDHQQSLADLRDNFLKQDHEARAQAKRAIEKLEGEHSDRMIDLVGNLDVVGLIQEMRAFRRRKREILDDTAEQQKQRQEQYAEQEHDMIAAYEKQRARRLEDHARQQADAEENFRIQEAQRAQADAQALADLEAQHALRLKAIQDEYQAEFNALYTLYEKESGLYTLRLQQYQDFIKEYNILSEGLKPPPFQFNGQSKVTIETTYSDEDYRKIFLPNTTPGRAAGGYVGPGLYRMGENGEEFVLDAYTTRVLTGRFGKLSQSLFRSGGAGGTVVLEQHNSYHGMTAADEGRYRRIAREEGEALLNEVARRQRRRDGAYA